MSIDTLPQGQTNVSEAAMGLLGRILPDRQDAFELRLDPQLNQNEFQLTGGGSQAVTVKGGNLSALTAGFNWYLKHYCHAHVSWSGNQLALPKVLPRLVAPVRIASPYTWRYYFNYCTFSYSMAWWDWARWEREIDWMALNGINLPLAVTGQEAVWQRVYRQLGLSDAELGEFFAGPAYLAWGWMGNLDGWGGPSPQSWIDGQCRLQKKILQRERELGMKPVLPAFTGHVPPALTRHFPKAAVKQLENWAETFTGTFILDPTDPLFQKIGDLFIDEQRKLYGSDLYGEETFYSCDSFNENSPPNNDPAYLDQVGKALYAGMSNQDPHAIWVLQDWMFFFNPTHPDFWQKPQIHALLDSVPDDRLLVLDLHSESHPLWQKTDALCGKPWVWCFLHGFGGHQDMFGNLQRLAHDPPATLVDPNRGSLVGFGLTAEGIEQNPVMYDLATDQMWRHEKPELDQWLKGYVRRRYGKATEPAMRAWDVLRRTVYNRVAGINTLVNLPPRWEAERVSLNFSNATLVRAWEYMVKAADELKNSGPFQHDLVDIARQVLANLATALQGRAYTAYLAGDVAAFRREGARFIAMIHDMDRLLATQQGFLLGAWIHDAKTWGTTDTERLLLERNARAQISLWGDHAGMLRDYARKEWAGMLSDYYAVRWTRFFEEQAACLERSEPFDDKDFQKRLRLWEEQWTRQTNPFPSIPTGDSIAVATELLAKYQPIFADVYHQHVNLITGKTVTASSGTRASHGPELAVTGIADRGSYWSAGKDPQWIQVDFGVPTQIDAVHLFPFWDNHRSYQYTIEMSMDSQTWSIVADAGQNTAPATPQGDIHRFTSLTARYLRVNVLHNSANEGKHILDLRAYGPAHPLS